MAKKPTEKKTRHEGRVEAPARFQGGTERRGAADSTDQRRADLAAIHVAKKDLQMADDTYRSLLWTIGRVDSSAKLDHAGRRRLLDHFRACGWKGRDRGAFPGKPRNAKQPDRAALMSKIEALLADAGRPWAYADGMAKKMFGVELLTWTTPEQLHKITAALVYDQQRRRMKAEGQANG